MATPKEGSNSKDRGLLELGDHSYPALCWVDEAGAVYPYKNAGNKPRVSTTPYLYSISEGEVAGHVPRRVLGRNAAVSTTLVDLTQLAGGAVPLPTSAVAMEIVSTSANDALAGTGVQSVEIHYLDADWNEVDEEIELAGLTPVNLASPAIRINGLHSKAVGSGGKAAGDIVVRTQGGAGTDYHVLKTGEVNSYPGIFSVPAGKTAFLVAWGWSAGKGKETEVRLAGNFDPFDFVKTDGAYNIHDSGSVLSASDSRTFRLPVKAPEKTDIILKAIVTDTGTVTATGSVEMWVE